MRAGLLAPLLLLAQPAAAQESIALAVEGWRTETRNDIVYYRCANQTCAAGSVVRQQPHRAALRLPSSKSTTARSPTRTAGRAASATCASGT